MTESPILWTSEAADRAVGSRSHMKWRATGVSIDSRAIAPGDLFVALKGPNHDGHDYVAQAIGEGAAAALVDADWARDQSHSLPLLPVRDTMEALEALARHKRETTEARIVGITGSVGKTGTKEALAGALSRFGETHKTMGNLNNHIGLPLTLARLPNSARFAVLEMGMNHTGEIDVLSRLGRPDIAIITTVEAVHLEFFDGIEGIADAKSEIFVGMTPNGTAILNRDNAFFDHIRDKAKEHGVTRVLSFGEAADADIRLINCVLHASCGAGTVAMDGTTIDYCVGAPGKHWILNTLAVLSAIRALGLDPVEASASFADLRAPRGRGAYRAVALPDGGAFGLIDESYNASPASVRAAIEVLGRAAPKDGGRRIMVLGDMLELGDDALTLHAGLAPDLERAGVDLLFACGPNMRGLFDATPATMRGAHADRSTELVYAVTDTVRDGDVVTVKGSLGTNMAPIVRALDGLATAATASNPSAATA